MISARTGYISVNDAAERLDIRPWAVHRLIASGEIRSIVLVDADSLPGSVLVEAASLPGVPR